MSRDGEFEARLRTVSIILQQLLWALMEAESYAPPGDTGTGLAKARLVASRIHGWLDSRIIKAP